MGCLKVDLFFNHVNLTRVCYFPFTSQGTEINVNWLCLHEFLQAHWWHWNGGVLLPLIGWNGQEFFLLVQVLRIMIKPCLFPYWTHEGIRWENSKYCTRTEVQVLYKSWSEMYQCLNEIHMSLNTHQREEKWCACFSSNRGKKQSEVIPQLGSVLQ